MKQPITVIEILEKLLKRCKEPNILEDKCYYQYEYDGNNLTKYEEMMFFEEIYILCSDPNDSEIMSLCLRTLIDHYGLLEGTIENIFENSLVGGPAKKKCSDCFKYYFDIDDKYNKKEICDSIYMKKLFP